MQKFSVIVPVFNRPGELEELLESLAKQTWKDFEIIVVEDGSSLTSRKVAAQYQQKLNLKYYFKENTGPGLSRNYGVANAASDFFIFLDSDCILPATYFESLSKYFINSHIDCFGGPDSAHESFTDIQKAISYSMTSFLTTGGMRGGGTKITRFHPRSFNMGFSKDVFLKTGGFNGMRFGEDIDLSLRIEQQGFNCKLIKEAFVYHKRRTDFKKFFKQIYNSGIARINLFKLHPSSLKLTHFFPAVFLAGIVTSIIASFFFNFHWFLFLMVVYLFLIFLHSAYQNKNIRIGALAVVATLVQMVSYGSGFIIAFIFRVILGKKTFSAFDKNFYK